MDKTDAVLFTILSAVILFFAGAVGWAIGQDQMQNEAIMTHNAHWDTLPNGHTLFKWNTNN